MLRMNGDKTAIVCNIAEPTKTARLGAKAFLGITSGGALGDGRAQLLIRSRGGRMIEKWEPLKRLTNFRLATIPPEHPLYSSWQVSLFESRESAQKEIGQLFRTIEKQHIGRKP